MQEFAERVPVKFLDKLSSADALGSFWRWYKETGGKVDDALQEYLPFLLVSQAYSADTKTPPVLSVGHKSLMSEHFPQWSADPRSWSDPPDTNLAHRARFGYDAVFEGEPTYCVLGVIHDRSRFGRQHMTYSRLAVPVSSPTGYRWVASFSVADRVVQLPQRQDGPFAPVN